MLFQDSIFSATIIVLMLTTIVFAIRYCNLLISAQKEYERAKNIISGIVFTFKRNQDRQNEKIDQFAFQVEATHSNVERLTIQFQEIENKFKSFVTAVDFVPTMCKEDIEYVNSIKKEVDIIAENQQTLQKQLVTLNKKVQSIDKEEKSLVTVNQSQPFSKLTETERVVLKFIMDEGAKTAPEVEQKIEKTREHAARLMKKLWQEGYIERDTHRIPYSYRVTESLKKMEIEV